MAWRDSWSGGMPDRARKKWRVCDEGGLRVGGRRDIITASREPRTVPQPCTASPDSETETGRNVDDIFLPSGRLRPDILDEATARVLREALTHTRATNWDSVRTPHLFMGLLAAPD